MFWSRMVHKIAIIYKFHYVAEPEGWIHKFSNHCEPQAVNQPIVKQSCRLTGREKETLKIVFGMVQTKVKDQTFIPFEKKVTRWI